MHNARLTLHIITFPEGQSAKWLDRQKMTLWTFAHRVYAHYTYSMGLNWDIMYHQPKELVNRFWRFRDTHWHIPSKFYKGHVNQFCSLIVWLTLFIIFIKTLGNYYRSGYGKRQQRLKRKPAIFFEGNNYPNFRLTFAIVDKIHYRVVF